MAAQPAFCLAAGSPHAPQIRKPDPHALCGCSAYYHHLLTGCSAGDGCNCRPCTGRTGRAACKCPGFLSYELVAQRRRDALDRALEWAADARD